MSPRDPEKIDLGCRYCPWLWFLLAMLIFYCGLAAWTLSDPTSPIEPINDWANHH